MDNQWIVCFFDEFHRFLTLSSSLFLIWYLLDDHLGQGTQFAKKLEADLELIRLYTDIAAAMPIDDEDNADDHDLRGV